MTHSLSQFAADLTRGTVMLHMVEHEIIEKSCEIVEHEAKRVIGTYDFGWTELAPATKADRVRRGFSENEPLLRTGDLRDSISHYVEDFEPVGYVGSPMKIALWQECGTKNIPPRSFLMGACMAKEHEIHELTGIAIHAQLLRLLAP